jgi:trimeric autotransporter adhesin
MKAISRWTIAITLLSGATAYGQVPAGNGGSDSAGNTGVGTSALGGPAATAAGGYNTATGFQALESNTNSFNAAFGATALTTNTSGSANTALGNSALEFNVSGGNNTASGSNALYFNDKDNTGASGNTADGAGAMNNNTSGSNNTAVGLSALQGANCPSTCGTGSYNTAIGMQSLYSNSTGAYNTASGASALYSNTSGTDNDAVGVRALFANTIGYRNTAVGSYSLESNQSGDYNNAVGYSAMAYNQSGSFNNAQGYLALENNISGNYNIAIGQYAGYYTTGSSNIDIGSEGAAGENNVIRIGNGASATYISGIYNNTSISDGLTVVINSNGQLGTSGSSSSERLKTDIESMGSNSQKLQRLRPVTFHYRADTHHTLRYGLIAEEVARVYPELVVRDPNGRIDGVRYDELTPMLLNELQQQAAEIRELKKQLVEMQAGLLELRAKGELVAER